MLGSIISSIKYINLKDGKAIATKTNAGEIVQTNSIKVPCTKNLCETYLFDLEYSIKTLININETDISKNAK